MFPNELKQLPNWVGYVYATKCPMDARTGSAARSSDPSTWSTYDEAVEAAARNGWDGIGFMFQPPYVGIDLDDCVVDGAPNEFARRILAETKSYAEFSPSRTGLHIICKGNLPAAIKKPFIEAYTQGRYFTVTNQPVQPTYPLREIDLSFLEEFRTQKIGSGPMDLAKRLAEVKEGSRNNDFFSIAGWLRRNGAEAEQIYGFLKPRAEELQFPDDELWALCRNACRYEPKVNPVKQTGPEDDGILAFLADRKPVEWLVKPLVAANSITFMAGLPKVSKTWQLIDLAVEAARGGMWLGKFKFERPCKVIYLDQERPKGETQRRFDAVIAAKDFDRNLIHGRLFVRCGTTYRTDQEESFQGLRKYLLDRKPDIVIVDSFRTFHTSEEANPTEIQVMLEAVKALRNEIGCAFMFIHHETKYAYQKAKEGEPASYLDMSGSVAIPAAAEHIFNVRRQDVDSCMVYHTANNLGETIGPFLVKVIDLNPEKSKIKVEAY